MTGFLELTPNLKSPFVFAHDGLAYRQDSPADLSVTDGSTYNGTNSGSSPETLSSAGERKAILFVSATLGSKGGDALPISETANSGTVIAKPAKGWTVDDASGVAVAAIKYAEIPEELERGDSKSIHLILTAHSAWIFADALTRAARKVLRSR